MHKTTKGILRISALLFCIILFFAAITPFASFAQKQTKNVRVGWYESPFNTTEKNGHRSGYAYEYQLKIAAYAGWEFTYVYGSWPELMKLLENGEIDLMSDVSYTEERAEKMLFGESPMGTEEYYIFISPKNTEITSSDYSTLKGKKVGVNAGSIMVGLFHSWAERNDVDAELVELTCEESESLGMLDRGELDAFITINAYGDPEKLVPVWRLGSSDFYFVVNNYRQDLLSELNAAMNRIHEESPYYNQMMFEKYVQRFGSNAFLTNEELSWLEGHGKIKIGYQDNYLAFCAQNKETGELEGALKDYLEYASYCFGNAHIEFEPVAFENVEEAISSLQRGEIDCVFPINFCGCEGEQMGILISPAIMRTDVFAVVRKNDISIFAKKEYVVVGVNEGNPNYDVFLKNNYPDWRTLYFPTTEACLDAIDRRLADCVLISSYRYNNIARLCDKYNLTTYTTGIAIDYSFAVEEGNTELYSILAKSSGLVPVSTVNASLSYYMTQDAKTTLTDFLEDHIWIVITIAICVVVIILLLMIRSIMSEKRAKKLIKATETDALTGLYSRNYFFEYANNMYRSSPDARRDAMVINIEQFHLVNAVNGREYGDRVLKMLGSEVGKIAAERSGIAGRFQEDRFDIYCDETDDYQAIFNRLQAKLEFLSPNSSIKIRMGVKPWQENTEPVQLFDFARTACNMARGKFYGRPIIFDDRAKESELRNRKLLGDLKHALDNFEFEVFFQPKFDISSDEPKLVSAEALIRWNHPELGLLTPDCFVSLFETNGKIFDVDKYVWFHAARQCASWRTQYGVSIPISVNISRVDIFEPELERTIEEILHLNGLERKDFMLEITETAYTENAEQVIKVIKNLRAKGYTVEMDDFGTGYSSLNMLSAMPIDVIKMDKSFVNNILNSERDVRLVEMILDLAGNLGVPVVAEGVENFEQLKTLKELGCRYAQGYFFSRPIHPSDFEERFLNNE